MARQIGWRDPNTVCFKSWRLEAILSPYSNQMLRNEWPLRTNQNPWQQVLRSFHPKETKPGTRTQSLAIWQVLEYRFSRFEIVVISNLNRTVLRIPFWDHGTLRHIQVSVPIVAVLHLNLVTSCRVENFVGNLNSVEPESNHSCLVPDLQEWVPRPSTHLQAEAWN